MKKNQEKKKIRIETIVLCISVGLIVINLLMMLFISIVILNPLLHTLNAVYPEMQMFNPMNEARVNVLGAYLDKNYYCVRTDADYIQKINKTESHEQCHALIDSDYTHFCDYQGYAKYDGGNYE